MFNLCGGWYDEPVMVELSSERGEIYYTLDGSEPDEHAVKYEGPILIEDRSVEENLYSAIDGIALDNT